MTTARYVTVDLTTGLLKEVMGATTVIADAIVALDAGGHINALQLPSSVVDVLVGVSASEAISAGAFVELYNVGGVLTARNATAKTAALQEAKCFAPAAAAGAPLVVDVYFTGALTAISSAASGAFTAGQAVYLDPINAGGATGAVVNAAPIAPDYVQFLGFARAASAGGGAAVSMGVRLERPVGVA